MALHWENLSSTTPSLTPKPQNRPLKIAKLTPCKKPEVAGSAGHCEPGVGRFTDPHPFTCSFFTPPFCWLMFGLCAPPKILPNPVLCVEKNILFHRGHPVLQCVAFAGPTGSAFSFLLFHSFSHPPLLSGGKNQFSLSWGLTAAPGFAHNRLTRLQQGRQPVSLVLLPYLAPKTAHRPSRGPNSFFLPRTSLPSPFRGRGWVSTFLGSPGLPCSFKTDSHWPNRAGIEPRWCPLPSSQNRTQGHTGASLYLLPFSPSLSRREVTVNYSSTRMSLGRRKYSPQWRFLL